MRSSRPAICAMSPSIRASSDEAGSAVGHDGLIDGCQKHRQHDGRKYPQE
jgi:hypothetical protein